MDLVNIGNDLARLPELRETGLALAAYARTISKGRLHLQGKQWISEPNFVAFLVQPRDRTLKLSLFGEPAEFASIDGVQLTRGRAGAYSSLKIDSPGQLAAAALHIRRAFELKRRRPRRKTRLVLKEEPMWP